MPVKGDAFARHEVSSVYVSPKARYVVSLVIGVDDASTPEEAAAIALVWAQDPTVIWIIHDRETGITIEVCPVKA